MIISCAIEKKQGENRVAITPNIAQKLINLGFEVVIENNAGKNAGFENHLYEDIGAKISSTPYSNADIICQIWAPQDAPKNATVIANFSNKIDDYKNHQAPCFALELMPRISRAQSMDILSSQSNLAGYKAVLETVNLSNKATPLMMTSAGTIAPSKFLILGVGVAGLQAIATAKRLGGMVYASDIRPETKEQVESLGGKFIESKDMPAQLKKSDIVITTALVAGNKAPILISQEMLSSIEQDCIMLDMASSQGGNIEGSVDNQIVELGGIKIIGNSNLASSVPTSASLLYAQNIFNFLSANYDADSKSIKFNFEDEIIQKTLINGDKK